MLGAIIRAISGLASRTAGAAVPRAAGAAASRTAGTAAGRAASKIRILPPVSKFRKSSKIFKPKVSPTSQAIARGSSRFGGKRPVQSSSAAGPLTPLPRINVPGKDPAANEQPPDRTYTDRGENSADRRGDVGDTTKDKGGDGGNDKGSDRFVDSAAKLALTMDVAKTAASSFIPSMTWTGGVSCGGFSTTPLRTVLHYALAVVFGMVHQFRVGVINLNVKLYPNENRVEVVFSQSSSLLLEPINIALAGAGAIFQNPLNGARALGAARKVAVGIAKMALGLKGFNDTVLATNDMIESFGNAARLYGPGGVWDMARSNYYAGNPPASMILTKCEPFTSMQKWTTTTKRPLLTRALTDNPQAPKVPQMHHPSFFDLRSLVAQALYDPGVLPPVPDTNVALPDQLLPT